MKKLLCVLVLMVFSANTAFAQGNEIRLRNSVNKLHDKIVELVDSDSSIAVENFVLAVDDVIVSAEAAGINDTEELLAFVRDEVLPENAKDEFDAIASKIKNKPTLKNVQQMVNDYQASHADKDEKVLGVLLGFLLMSVLLIGIMTTVFDGEWEI